MKLLPQHLRRSDWQSVADQLDVFFQEEIITPVMRIVRGATAQKVHNARGQDALRRAIQSGKIQYARGIFSGEFGAAISSELRKMGATWDRRAGVFRLSQWKAPQWVEQEAAVYRNRAFIAHQAITYELDQAVGRIASSRYDVDADEMIDHVDGGWRRSAAKLAIKPPLTKEGKAALAENYSNNLDLYIKKWLSKDIIRLRRDVQKNAEAGYRFDSLIETIQRRSGVGRRKAKFLARQETGLFMSEYREQRFKDAGVKRYQWSTSHDSRVRPEASLTPQEKLHAGNHRILDGQIFTYQAKAPGRFMSSGQPCNPGQDFNCRCVDIPLLD